MRLEVLKVGARVRVVVVVEEGENEQISTVMQLMSVSNSASPHR